MSEAMKKALERQREITNAAKAENRDLTEAEQREFDNLTAIIAAIAEREADATPPAGGGNNEPTPPNNPPAPTEPEGGNPDGTRAVPGNNYTAANAAAIAAMCRYYDMDASDFLSRGLTLEQASREIVARQMSENTPIGSGITVTNDENDKVRSAMTDGIILRGEGHIETPADGANRYRGLTIRDLAVECLERDGVSGDLRHKSNDELYDLVSRSFYNPESSFPAILDDVVRKSYIEGLAKATTTFERWCRFGSLTNFKKTTNHEYIMSLGGELEKVPENGELKNYVPSDAKMPERQLDTYGRSFSMTRKAFIDDDIGVVTSMPRRFAAMSQRTQNKLVYSLLLNSKPIFDGKMLFSQERGNTLKDADATAVTLAAIEKMFYKIGLQKDAAGNQLALAPDALIVPLGMGARAKELLSTPTIFNAEGGTRQNAWYNSFDIIEDVTLNGFVKEGAPIPWFMLVKGEVVQVDYLNGQREATIRRGEVPGKLGMQWDVYHDVGVSVVHPQAICRNPGVTLASLGLSD